MAGLQLAGVSALRAIRHENECNRALERFYRAHCAQIQALEAQGYEVKIARDWGTPADAWYLVLTPKKERSKAALIDRLRARLDALIDRFCAERFPTHKA